MDQLLKLATLVYEAIGAESPRRFIAGCALVGLISFTVLGWLTVKGYEANLRRNHPDVGHTTGDATTFGKDSPAITGHDNTVTYGDPKPDPAKQPPKAPK